MHIPLRLGLQHSLTPLTMNFMRALSRLLILAAFLFGVYYFYVKRMPATESSVAPTQEINLTGVTGDLLQIAEAERAYMALNNHCASLEEMIASGSISMTRTERDGYSYSIACSGDDFTATARHAPAPAGSPIRYPNLAVDSTLLVHEIN